MTDDRIFIIAEKLFWVFIGSLHPTHVKYYIEADPDNPEGTRSTERGQDLFQELEEFVREIK